MSTKNPDSLKARVAAEKQPAVSRELQTRVACAWTLAKTMLPEAPNAEQMKFASNLLGNSTTALKVALRQTAVNAHWTRVAEQFASVHKTDLNDLLEDPSVLTKEKAGIAAELKGDPKNASGKVADDRKDCGPLPAEYPEPARHEPSELDGSHAAEGRPESWTEGPSSKDASRKVACGEECKGCENCKKEAGKKKADALDGDPTPADVPAEAADDAAAVADVDAAHADEAAADADLDAVDADVDADVDAPVDGNEETFDPEIANLTEIADDLDSDIDRLQDTLSDLEQEPSDLDIPEDSGDLEGFDIFGDEDGEADLSVEETPNGGEELNLDEVFNPENLEEKVAGLNNEDDISIEAEFDGDDFFAPSDGAELESILEHEEALSSPADMFKLEGVENDPMARLFASKEAAAEGVVEPGDLADHFEATHGPDGRDAETDHDGTIFEDVLNSITQPKYEGEKRDTQPNLKEPKAAGKKEAAPIRRLRPNATGKGSKAAAARATNLASLLFTDEADYL